MGGEGVRALETWLEMLSSALRKRTPETALIKKRIIQFGAGGVGTWTATMIALHADPKEAAMLIVDADKLELHNANRLPYPISWFLNAKNKANALAQWIEILRPGIEVKALPIIVEVDQAVEIIESFNADIIIDAVDNVVSIKLIKEVAKKAGVPRLSIHYDGYHGTVEWDPTGDATGWEIEADAAQYTTPSMAMVPAALAITAVSLILQWPEKPLTLTVNLSP